MPTVEKMVEPSLEWFGNVWRRLIEAPVKKVDQMEGSPIDRDRRRPSKTIGKTIKRDLDVNYLNINMMYDRTIWHEANPI